MTVGIICLVIGVLLAAFGGGWFVDGAVGLAKKARWPVALIGATVAAFGTSTPELMVAINASLDGVPQVSFGDVLGSSVVNILLVLGLVMVIKGVKTGSDAGGRNWFAGLALPGLVLALVEDGWFSRWDALILLTVFFVWLAALVREARSFAAEQKDEPVPPSADKGKVWLYLIGGLVLLIVAAQFVVHGGRAIAEYLGWSPFIVGAVVVAVATSTPELATTLIATLKGHDEAGLSNILGSNIFNVAFIASIAALIHPFAVQVPEIMPSLWFGFGATLVLWTPKDGFLGRGRGVLLLAAYAWYVTLTVSEH